VKFTVWRRGKEPVLGSDPTSFDSEEDVVKAFSVQVCPDEEFSVKIEDGERVKYCSFDGQDGLVILAILCYRGLKDEVFSMYIKHTLTDECSHIEKYFGSDVGKGGAENPMR